MGKVGAIMALGLTLAAMPTRAQSVLGEDAAACRIGSTVPAALVRVRGFKDGVGELRVQLYSDVPDDFLASGKKLRRIVVPMPGATIPGDEMDVCIQLPTSGRYAVAILHDRDSDHKLSIWRDGVGFSNNPKIGLGKPDLSEVLFDARPGLSTVNVVLNYRSGLAVRPLAGR